MAAQPIHACSDTLMQIASDLDHFVLEPAMRAKVSEHYHHLEQLAASLKKVGVEEAMIDQHVIEIFLKYKTELLKNIEKYASP